VPDGVEAFSTWKEVTVVYHEGVPGHHLQISHASRYSYSAGRLWIVLLARPIVIPLFLALGIAAPYIADSRANKRRRVHKKGKMTP
jgi:hypothetical protein